MSKAENEFQANLIIRLKRLFPGCLVLKNDSSYIQGIPDLTVLWMGRWAMLEVKASEGASVQNNQPYWVTTANDMSFAAFIYPENEEDVLLDLQQAFSSGR